MTRKWFFLIGGLLIAVVLVSTLVVYSQLPAQIPVHWNASGEVDRYGSRSTALVMMPCIMAGLLLLTAVLPWLSPRRFEMNGSNNAYLLVMLAVVVFMAYMHFVMLAAALGRHVRMDVMVIGAICAMFAAMGLPLARVRRNFFVGVRTPWTLASEDVWRETHRFAAKTFVVGGLLGLALSFLAPAFWAPMVVIGIAGLAPVIYSLVYYKQLERRGKV